MEKDRYTPWEAVWSHLIVKLGLATIILLLLVNACVPYSAVAEAHHQERVESLQATATAWSYDQASRDALLYQFDRSYVDSLYQAEYHDGYSAYPGGSALLVGKNTSYPSYTYGLALVGEHTFHTVPAATAIDDLEVVLADHIDTDASHPQPDMPVDIIDTENLFNDFGEVSALLMLVGSPAGENNLLQQAATFPSDRVGGPCSLNEHDIWGYIGRPINAVDAIMPRIVSGPFDPHDDVYNNGKRYHTIRATALTEGGDSGSPVYDFQTGRVCGSFVGIIPDVSNQATFLILPEPAVVFEIANNFMMRAIAEHQASLGTR